MGSGFGLGRGNERDFTRRADRIGYSCICVYSGDFMKGENKQQRYYRTQKNEKGRAKVCVMSTPEEAKKIIAYAKDLRRATDEAE